MAHNSILIVSFYIFKIFITIVNTVPPERCFAKFRWDDCGKPPTPVIYYYHSGSRCEVALWRGCYPNYNMFENEYECVATCIFTMRALPADYHNLIESPDVDIELETTEADLNVTSFGNDTLANTTDSGNLTDDNTGPTGGANVEDATKAEGEEDGGGEPNPEEGGDEQPAEEEAPAEEK